MKNPGIYVAFVIVTCICHSSNIVGQAWTDLGNSGYARYRATSFTIGTTFYVGLGWGMGSQQNTFAAYDSEVDSWASISPFPGLPREGAVGFSLNGKGYVVTGSSDPSIYPTDLWQYDPASNEWSEKANFPGGGRKNAVAFTIGNKAYVGSGLDFSGTIPAYLADFHEYDPVLDQWNEITGLPAAAHGRVAFTIDQMAYVGTGSSNLGPISDFWRYDPAADTWTGIAPLPGVARAFGMSFTVNGKGYVVGGSVGSTFGTEEVWEFRPGLDEWYQRQNFSDGRQMGCATGIGDYGYVGFGSLTAESGFIRGDLWRFDPSVTSSVRAIPTESFSCYPNPVKDALVLSTPNSVPIEAIEIMSPSGQLIHFLSAKWSGSQLTVDVHDLAPGYYLIVGTWAQQKHTARFVKY